MYMYCTSCHSQFFGVSHSVACSGPSISRRRRAPLAATQRRRSEVMIGHQRQWRTCKICFFSACFSLNRSVGCKPPLVACIHTHMHITSQHRISTCIFTPRIHIADIRTANSQKTKARMQTPDTYPDLIQQLARNRCYIYEIQSLTRKTGVLHEHGCRAAVGSQQQLKPQISNATDCAHPC